MLLLAWLPLGIARAQGDTATVSFPTCASALAALSDGSWPGAAPWAPGLSTRCGSPGLRALAAGIRAARLSSDSAALSEVFGSARARVDTGVFEALAFVALSNTSTVASRVHAVRALLAVFESSASFSPTWALAATSASGCSPALSSASPPDLIDVSPGARWAEIRSQVEALADAPSAPIPVRAAAGCVAAAGARDPGP